MNRINTIISIGIIFASIVLMGIGEQTTATWMMLLNLNYILILTKGGKGV